MYKFCLFALLVVAVPSLADANGGGNTKGVGSITITNNSTNLLLVAVDPTSSQLSSTSINQFSSRGGRVLNAGASTTFKNVTAGIHSVLRAQTTSSATTLPTPTFTAVTVTRNVTTNLTAQ